MIKTESQCLQTLTVLSKLNCIQSWVFTFLIISQGGMSILWFLSFIKSVTLRSIRNILNSRVCLNFVKQNYKRNELISVSKETCGKEKQKNIF